MRSVAPVLIALALTCFTPASKAEDFTKTSIASSSTGVMGICLGCYLTIDYTYTFSHSVEYKHNSWTYRFPEDPNTVTSTEFNQYTEVVKASSGTFSNPSAGGFSERITDESGHGSYADYALKVFQAKTRPNADSPFTGQIKVDYETELTAKCIANKKTCGEIQSWITFKTKVGDSGGFQDMPNVNSKLVEVPGPLPAAGAILFFDYARRLRNTIKANQRTTAA